MRVFIGYVVLGLAGATASGQPIPETNLVFEVASVRPHVSGSPGSTGRTGIQEDAGQIQIENLSLRTLIAISFDLKGRGQLVGPRWLSGVTFDIVARPPAGYKREQLQYLLRNLLTDRFKLSVHHETRPISAFVLVVAKGGPKLHESTGPRTYHTGRQGLIEGNQWSMTELADALARLLEDPVANQTGLRALYDLKLEWTPDAALESPDGANTEAAAELGPSLFTALQEQLGLRLESRKLAADVVVVDHVERAPTEN
jgi:uncharacterized protein (TIGR03435 family)